MITCLYCHAEFNPRGPNHKKFCTVSCRDLYLSEARKAARRETLRDVECEFCGAVFRQAENGVRYCSHSCAVKASAERRVKPMIGRCRGCGAPRVERNHGPGYCSEECRKATQEKQRAARQARRFLKKWNLTAGEYAALIANGCEVCGSHDDLKVDHDHSCCAGSASCGKCIRGCLCGRCNAAEGMLLSNPDRALALAFYMLKNTNVLEALRA